MPTEDLEVPWYPLIIKCLTINMITRGRWHTKGKPCFVALLDAPGWLYIKRHRRTEWAGIKSSERREKQFAFLFFSMNSYLRDPERTSVPHDVPLFLGADMRTLSLQRERDPHRKHISLRSHS